ncbi:helix-turn-helix domain-containing protein [Aureibacter tunicatorum]|uniref:AraC-like DNA-binding protein n=1 Tax=Aureibacter tunicatorum TaxID=866807 RepID=A0AAE3XRD3_9BACT|nr:AraC family transcriptional regulator [Aureibacter tunicatorum]MDR6240496.1 AraC-like DNA-binding protein [Aureibacter tunicatorum]BDD06641.1 AraC family transcriptional regulator [Aureibacter tunicatorum]
MTDFLKIMTLSEMFKLINLPAPKHPLITLIDYSKTPLQAQLPPCKVICDFYQITLKSDKNGFLKYGREKYDYQEGSLIYLAPGQVVQFSDAQDIQVDKGWSLFFHADLIRSFSLEKKMKDYGFFNYQSNEALHISEREKEIIDSIIKKMQIELDSHLDEYSEEVMVSNLELLLNYSKRFYNRQFITRKRFDVGLIAKFTELLETYFDEDKQKQLGLPTVQYFADELNYSSNYLNELIKKSTDRSILEHVHFKVIEMAKTKLLNTNMSISEIAYELGFEYSQYFSRLFKKKTGMTPISYRNIG